MKSEFIKANFPKFCTLEYNSIYKEGSLVRDVKGPL